MKKLDTVTAFKKMKFDGLSAAWRFPIEMEKLDSIQEDKICNPKSSSNLQTNVEISNVVLDPKNYKLGK